MTTPTAFISPRNVLQDATASGWTDGDGTTTIGMDAGTDGRPDTVTRFTTGDASPMPPLAAYWTLPAAKPVQVLALLNHSIPAGVEVVAVLYDAGFTMLDSQQRIVGAGVEGYPRNMLFLFDQPVDATIIFFSMGDYVRGDPLSNGLAIDVGEFWAGQVWMPAHGVAFDTPIAFVDPSIQLWSAGGQGFTAPRNIYREVSLQFPALTEAELIGSDDNGLSLKSIFGTVGTRSPVLIAPTASSPYLLDALAICGLLTSSLKPRPVGRKDGARVWSASLDVRELR